MYRFEVYSSFPQRIAGALEGVAIESLFKRICFDESLRFPVRMHQEVLATRGRGGLY